MSDIARDDVVKLATQSSLKLNEEEVKELNNDLQAIISYVEKLSELDTSNVEPLFQITDLKNIWQEDEVQLDGDTSVLLEMTKEVKSQQIKIPKVL